jgi:hypothetical protein
MKNHAKGPFVLAAISLALIAGVGCGPTAEEKTKTKTPAVTDDDHAGPHKGHIIELGRDHVYHGELVHDDATESVSIYILGKGMKESPIEQKTVTITTTIDGKTETHELAAVDAKDGKTAHFRGDKKLFEAIEAVEKDPKAKARLSLTIGDKPYSGDIELKEHKD